MSSISFQDILPTYNVAIISFIDLLMECFITQEAKKQRNRLKLLATDGCMCKSIDFNRPFFIKTISRFSHNFAMASNDANNKVDTSESLSPKMEPKRKVSILCTDSTPYSQGYDNPAFEVLTVSVQLG